jgi:hypothetical protein
LGLRGVIIRQFSFKSISIFSFYAIFGEEITTRSYKKTITKVWYKKMLIYL